MLNNHAIVTRTCVEVTP